MIEKGGDRNSDRDERAFKKKLLIGLIVLACLTPLGIILPRIAGGGEAWGEWGPEYLHKALGYLPEGLQKSIGVWHAPVSGYALPAAGDSLASQIASYAASGVAGLLIIVAVVFIVMKVIKGHER